MATNKRADIIASGMRSRAYSIEVLKRFEKLVEKEITSNELRQMFNSIKIKTRGNVWTRQQIAAATDKLLEENKSDIECINASCIMFISAGQNFRNMFKECYKEFVEIINVDKITNEYHNLF